MWIYSVLRIPKCLIMHAFFFWVRNAILIICFCSNQIIHETLYITCVDIFTSDLHDDIVHNINKYTIGPILVKFVLKIQKPNPMPNENRSKSSVWLKLTRMSSIIVWCQLSCPRQNEPGQISKYWVSWNMQCNCLYEYISYETQKKKNDEH